MKQVKKKAPSNKRDVNRQKKECKDLSKGLAVKYSRLKMIDDGGMKQAMLALVGDNRCEDTIHCGLIVVQKLQKLYESEALVRTALDISFSKDQLWGKPVSVRDVIEGLVQFYKMIFNFYTPGWVDMHRLKSNPERFTEDELDYIDMAYLDDAFAESWTPAEDK